MYEPDAELLEAACMKRSQDIAVQRYELADNGTGCKKVTEEIMEYVVDGMAWHQVPAQPMITEEEAPASECCAEGCNSLGSEVERPELLSVCHISSIGGGPTYSTDNNGRPLCLKEIVSNVEYRLSESDADAMCSREKTESLSN